MTLAVLVAWKLSFYGELLPTAFYSKSAASPYYLQGLRYVGLYLAKSWYLLPALIVVPWLAGADRPTAPGLAAASERNDRLVFLATAGFLAAYVLHSGGDFMFARRHGPDRSVPPPRARELVGLDRAPRRAMDSGAVADRGSGTSLPRLR